ncbi:MAG TPA: hypothetical protein DCP68_08045 [Ruminococcus sp.]|nr:hypothetical protein [Ruminococcus sp.]
MFRKKQKVVYQHEKVPETPPPSFLRKVIGGMFRFEALFFAAAFLWWEIVFKFATIRSGFSWNLCIIALFSVGYAMVPVLLTSFFKEKIARVLRSILLFLGMIPFGVEFFIFQEYNIFYDIKTIINGAGGAATGFIGEIMNLILSVSGILMLVLLAIPPVLYLILKKRCGSKDANWPARLGILLAALICIGGGIGLSHGLKSYAAVYSKEYSFPSAIRNFGLLTGIRLDITHGRKDTLSFENAEFEPEEEPAVTTAPADIDPENTATAATTVSYPVHTLDIDFERLAQEDSGQYASLSEYITTLKPASGNQYTGMFKGKNLIFLTAEAFTKEVISKELTPTLYRLSTKGIQFKDFYQPACAGTTGGEFQNIFGLHPMFGGASFPSFTAGGNTGLTLASQLNRQHYWGKAYHNNDFTFYSRHITHNQLGFSEGFMGYGNGMEQYVTYEWPQSDQDMIKGTIPEYIGKPHFNVYYMTVSGHNGYDRFNAMSAKHWDEVEDLPYSEPVKAYIACNLDLEAALTDLVAALEKKGIADDTVICMTADHFPYGLDDNASYGNMPYLSELYGYNVVDAVHRDHNAAIIWSGCLEDAEPIVVDAPASSLDLLPTLSNLFGLDYDSRLMPGRDVLSDAEAIYFDRDYNWKTDRGYFLAETQTFYPNTEHDAVSDTYIERIKAIVRNKINYCQGVLNCGYLAHVLPQ